MRRAYSGERRQRPHARDQAHDAQIASRDSRVRSVASAEKVAAIIPQACFAVQKAPIARGGFQRVAQRVAEIQDLAQAAFAFVVRPRRAP